MNRTQRARIKSMLRKLWLMSKERYEALKEQEYSCQCCGVKKSVAKRREQKVEVHHREGVGNWDKIVDLIQEELLCNPDKLVVLCPECHRKAHHG